jgi:hypothetical protein
MHHAKALPRRQRALLQLAEWSGTAARVAGKSASDATGLLGAALVSYGAGQVYAPLFAIVAGGFLLAIARNLR